MKSNTGKKKVSPKEITPRRAAPVQRWFLDIDWDCNVLLVPVERATEWVKWLSEAKEAYPQPKWPSFVKHAKGGTSTVTFVDPKIGKDLSID